MVLRTKLLAFLCCAIAQEDDHVGLLQIKVHEHVNNDDTDQRGSGSPTPAPPSAYYTMITSTYDLNTDKGQKECLLRPGHDEAGVSNMGCSYGVRLKACLPWDKGGYKGNYAPKAEWLMQVCCRAQCCAQAGGNCWDTSLITSSTTTTTIYLDLDTNSDSQAQCLYDHGYGNGNFDCNTGAGFQNCGGKSGKYPQSAEFIRMGLNGSSRGPAHSAMCNNGNLCKSKEKWSPQKEYVQNAVCFCCASSCAKLGGLCDDWKATSTTTTTTPAPPPSPPPSPPSPGGQIEDGVCHGTEDISEGTSVADSPCFDADTGFGPGFSCDTTKMWCGHDSGDGLVVGQCCPKKCRAECEQKKKKGDSEGRNKAEKERKQKRSQDEAARKSAEKERKKKRKQDEWQNKRDAKEADNKKAEEDNKKKNGWAEKKRKNERKWKQGFRDRKEKANKRERTRKSERGSKESKNKNGQANNQAERDRKEKRKKKGVKNGDKEKGKKEKRQKKKKNKGRKGRKGRKGPRKGR